jgi:endonuclease-3
VPRPTKAVAIAPNTFERLRAAHPDAHCELVHQNPFQLVVATVLSAQATDVIVNKVTPDLFQKYPDPAALAAADPAVVEQIIGRLGMFRQKTKNIVGLAKKLVAEHGGEVPRSLAELVELPGVGRKTANVVLGVAFQSPEGVVVDTHVQRITQRLGWTKATTPEKIEPELMTIFPRRDWDMLSHVLIFHGRRVCYARKPSCVTCTVTDVCPSAFKAELVGRKPGRADSDSTAKSRAGKGRGAAKNARAKPRPARANTGKGSKATSKVARAAKSKQSGPSAAR